MAALDFPANPTNGQLYPAAPNAQYIYNATAGGPSVGAWESLPMESAKTVTADVPPADPKDGDQWFNTIDGTLYIYVVDVDGGQWVESQAPITANGYYSPNYIINGGFDIWQRGTSFTSANGYTADRWQFAPSGATANVTQQVFPVGQTDVDGSPTYFLRMAVTTGNDYARLIQPIENVRTLAGKTITVSFWAKGTNPGGGKVYVGYIQSNSGTAGTSNYNAADVTLTSSWQRFSRTITIPTLSGTIVEPSYLGLTIGQGQDTSTAAWTLDLANVQVEEGSIATTFRRNANSIQGELAACQRYYFRFTGGQYKRIGMHGDAASASAIYAYVMHPVVMRAAPTSTDWSGLVAYDGTNILAISSISGDTLSPQGTSYYISTSGATSFRHYIVALDSTGNGYFGISAEL